MRLACVTVPNFRIALERLRAPNLAGRPLAIGEPPPGENQIIDCSSESAALGIRTGMPLRDARTVVPDLTLLPPDPVYYSRSADALLDAIESTEPDVEPGEIGSAFAAIDPHADESAQADAAAHIIRVVLEESGVQATAGVGGSKFIAWIAATASASGEAIVVPAGREQEFVAPLSTSFLPVSYDAQRKFTLYGLHTIGAVAALSIGPMQAQFGSEGRRIHSLAHGIDTTPFRPRARVLHVAGTVQMPAPTVNSEALLIAARQLVGKLLQQPAMRYRQARQLRLRLSLLDSGSWERTLTLREPLSDEARILFVLKKLIESLQLAGPVEEMTLDFLALTSETGKQQSLLFAEQARHRARLMAALRQLKTHFGGESQVAHLVEVEPWSRIPERRYALIDYDL